MIQAKFFDSGISWTMIMQEETRRTERVKAFLKAQILYNNRMTTIDCIVKNLSSEGAKIALNDSVSVPSEFDLYIPLKARTYRARMIWRDATSMGVEFEVAETEELPAQDAASSDTQALRIRALEMQNMELKTRVRELSKRLEDLGQDPDLTNSKFY
jgi:hypothetical protein